jgi:hypothetical protein
MFHEASRGTTPGIFGIWFSNFNIFLEFGKTLRNFKRRFKRNLDMGICLNSFGLLKDFYKIKYAMS